MATEITNNGSSLKILKDGTPRFILKNQIKGLEIVRDTIIKIDIGQGALHDVFIDQAEVTTPASPTVNDLLDQLMAMLQTVVAATVAETNQAEEITQIKNLQASVIGLTDKVASIDNKLFYKPVVIDESNPNVVYEGYAAPGAANTNPVWAIQRITNARGIMTHQWSGGTKTLDKIWDNRKTLMYS